MHEPSLSHDATRGGRVIHVGVFIIQIAAPFDFSDCSRRTSVIIKPSIRRLILMTSNERCRRRRRRQTPRALRARLWMYYSCSSFDQVVVQGVNLVLHSQSLTEWSNEPTGSWWTPTWTVSSLMILQDRSCTLQCWCDANVHTNWWKWGGEAFSSFFCHANLFECMKTASDDLLWNVKLSCWYAKPTNQ